MKSLIEFASKGILGPEDGGVTPVNTYWLTQLLQAVESEIGEGIKLGESQMYEDHRVEPGNMGAGDFHIVRWTADFETLLKVDPGADEQAVRDAAMDLIVPEGPATYIGDTFSIESIERKEE